MVIVVITIEADLILPSTSSPCEMGPVKRLESIRLDIETMTVCKKEGKCGIIQEEFKERWKRIPPC